MYAAAIVLILALGADSVAAQAAPENPRAQLSKPLSGGSTVSPSGAISGGTIKKPPRARSKAATRRRVKKS
jgi:hypothetical protein